MYLIKVYKYFRRNFCLSNHVAG